MGKKRLNIAVLCVFLALFLLNTLPYSSATGTISLIENTNNCIYQPSTGKDYCYSIYRLCGVSFNPSLLTFQFKTDKDKQYRETLKDLDFQTEFENDGSCKKIKIEAHKSPFQNIDNVPCFDGGCFYEYAWWNSSFYYKYLVNATNYGSMNMTSMVLLNDTSGININGSTQFIWCNYTTQPNNRQVVGYFYYNDTFMEACVDAGETDQVPMIVDTGNGTSYGSPSNDITLFWTANSTKEYSSYDFSVTVGDNAHAVANGKIGYAYDFDGTLDVVYFGSDEAQHEAQSAVTAVAWVKLDVVNTSGKDCAVFGKFDRSGGGSGVGWGIYYVGIYDKFYARVSRNSGANEYDAISSTTGFSSSQWYFVAETYDGETVKIYINGVERGNNTDPSGSADGNSRSLSAGAFYYSGGWNFWNCNGQIDNAIAWDRVLTADEIMAIYNNTVGNQDFAVLGDVEKIPYIPPVVPPVIENVSNMTVSFEISNNLPVKNQHCSGNNLIITRERSSCFYGDVTQCITTNQTDVTQCAFGCEENLSVYGAECVPSTFQTLWIGWGLFFLAFMGLYFFAYSLKKKKKNKGIRWL